MNDDVFVFESWVGGEVDASFGRILNDRSDYPSDISFGNNFHFAINNETGLVHGFGLRGWVQGKIDGKSVKVSINFQYELEGYAMQDYQFGEFIDFNSENGSNSNLYYLFFIPGTVTVGVIVFIVYRRKKKKVGNELL